jgi:hypothetical protein
MTLLTFKYLASLLLVHLVLLFTEGKATKMEQELTGGNIKRWIFIDHEYTLGSDCKTSILTFKLDDHTFFEKPCDANDATASNRKGKWRIQETGPQEHQITLGSEKYFLDFYDSTVNNAKVRTMRLRKKATRQDQPTVSAIYYEEQ